MCHNLLKPLLNKFLSTAVLHLLDFKIGLTRKVLIEEKLVEDIRTSMKSLKE